MAGGLTALAAPLSAQDGIGPSSGWLGLLPDGEVKRKFILDCTGCHQFDAKIARVEGRPRSESEWVEAVTRMLGYAGARTSFPVISADRDAQKTAAWLVKYLGTGPLPAPKSPKSSRAEITEFLMPEEKDLPHDIAVERSGTVLVTGMFTHRLYRVDPVTTRIQEIAIPVPNANPRVVEIDSLGQPWVVLGSPHPTLGRGPGGPIPYEIRVGPDGRVWGSELVGNRIFAFTPATGKFEVFPLPVQHSGPRRLDVDAGGIVWIPAFAANLLLRFDPKTGKFTEVALPFRDAVPCIIRADPRSGALWVGTSAADALLRYDPASGQFDSYGLPTRGAMIRHLAIDPRSGAVWAAYGASPGIPARIARVRPH